MTGRYHEIILTDNEYTESTEDTYTGNFINITITTDASNVGNIVGDFSQEGWSDNATDAPDYAWIGISFEGYENGEYNGFYIDLETTVSSFTISKDGNAYTISITGTGERGDGVTEESGDIEVYFKGELTWWP
jgi:hypothetical protein